MASFSRRSIVEGVFGIWKSANGTEVSRGWTRLTGLVKTTILLTAVVAANNIHAVCGWLRERYPGEGQWLVEPSSRPWKAAGRARRRDTRRPPATGPPQNETPASPAA